MNTKIDILVYNSESSSSDSKCKTRIQNNNHSYANIIALIIIKHKIFEVITITVIAANSIKIAIDDPTSTEVDPIGDIVEYVFLSFYTVEMILKIIGLGFILNKGSYLRDPWNILDFLIVTIAYI